jgi:hypothetical protein
MPEPPNFDIRRTHAFRISAPFQFVVCFTRLYPIIVPFDRVVCVTESTRMPTPSDADVRAAHPITCPSHARLITQMSMIRHVSRKTSA